MEQILAKGFTHNGTFHADDVFSAALLSIINPEIVFERGSKPPEDFDGIVFDVGGGAFDHHGASRRVRDNGVPYAAFGLLWERFGTDILPKEDAEEFDERFVQPLDDADNGGKPNLLSQVVADFNPSWGQPAEEYNLAFVNAVDWARAILQRRFDRVLANRQFHEYLEKCMRESDGRVLVLGKLVPWKTLAIGSTYRLVIYPSVRGGYNIQAVPRARDGFETVLYFPEAWRGRSVEELQELTGISDFTFCHVAGYLCAADTLPSAIRVAELALEAAKDR